MCPASNTATRSAKRRTRFRSCVISSTAMPYLRCRSASNPRICARSVTSSAVVGSSASSSRGLQASAIAIIARCRWPPDSWCAKAWARRAGSGMPVSASNCTAASCAARPDRPSCSSSTSAIWLPTGYSGLSAVIGSWKIIAISLPRMPRSSCSEIDSRSRPPCLGSGPKRLATPESSAFWTSRSSASAVTVLPEPDSPTSASFSPAAIWKSMPCTTASPLKATRRFWTSSKGVMRAKQPNAEDAKISQSTQKRPKKNF